MAEAAPSIAPLRPGIRSAIFLGVMLGTSGLTMLRMVMVASLLPMSAFATYATIIATGAFLSGVISFGLVEATIKSFPRMVAEGNGPEMRQQAGAIFAALALRALLAGLPIFLIGVFAGVSWLRDLGIAFVFALATASMAIVASMQRAVANSTMLASGTAFRTVCVVIAVMLAASLGDLAIVLAAEVISTALACYLTVRLYFRAERTAAHPDPAGPPQDTAAQTVRDRGGLAVFLAFSAVNVPFYLDRLFVGAVLPAAAPQYAFLALLLTAASLLVNTLAQRVGPDAISMAYRDGNGRAATRHVVQWIGVSSLLWLLAVGVIAAAFASGLLPSSLARYGIAPAMMAPIAVSGILLNTALLEFLLIATDREGTMLRCALIFLALVLLAFLTVAGLGLSLLALMWLLAGCRMVYAIILIFALHSPSPSHKG